jgi:hypothetical protein
MPWAKDRWDNLMYSWQDQAEKIQRQMMVQGASDAPTHLISFSCHDKPLSFLLVIPVQTKTQLAIVKHIVCCIRLFGDRGHVGSSSRR